MTSGGAAGRCQFLTTEDPPPDGLFADASGFAELFAGASGAGVRG
jgi:hypothetical protein